MDSGCTLALHWLYTGCTLGGKERMEQTGEQFITQQKESVLI